MSEKSKINFRGIIKGVMFSIVTTVILVIFIALISYFANMNEKLISVLLFSSSVLSTLLGAFFVTKNISENGLIHGMFVGFGYYLIILAASVVVRKAFVFNVNMLTMFIADLAGGMLGGILGINSK